jgi:hypothetical protein
MIPETRQQAIAMLVEHDVARWGEGEREASQRLHAFRSYGLAINEMANRAKLNGPPAGWPTTAELRSAAKTALTPEDRDWLRKGG